MALETKDEQTCPKCGREPVRLYKTKIGWICGKCLSKMR